jgi:hypothetical protein
MEVIRRVFARRSALLALAIVAAFAGTARAEYQCAPGTPIPGGPWVVPFTIATPGCYFLAGNRTMNGAAPAIQINASHVYLDLRGRTLRHIVAGQTIISGPTTPITDVHVTNGKLTGAQGGFGVAFTNQFNGTFNVSDLMITDDGANGAPGIGIRISAGPPGPAHVVIARNTMDVPRVGIELTAVTGGRIENNVLNGYGPTPTAGIQLIDSQGNDIRDNTISGMFLGGVGAGIHLTGVASGFNNVRNNTIMRSWDGIRVDAGNCNAIDWNVANGNSNSGITFAGASANNVYSFNRASGACTSSGAGIQDLPGTNINAGNNF